jgi:hypothetical protein
LRLIRFVFRGVAGFWRSDRILAFVGGRHLSPHPGLGFGGGTEPSAHALGYLLAALRAWGHGLGQGWWVGFVSLVAFVVEQPRRVEPRSTQRARKEVGKDRAMGSS